MAKHIAIDLGATSGRIVVDAASEDVVVQNPENKLASTIG